MAFDAPSLPPELLALFSKRMQANALGPPAVAPPPAAGMAPAVPSAQPAPVAAPATGAPDLGSVFGRPTTQFRTKFDPPQGAAPTPSPAPSDDTALTGSLPALPAIPQPGPLMTRFGADVAKRGAIQAPDPTKLRPKLWERLAGAATGFAAGWGNAARGAEIGGGVTNRRFNRAENEYQAQVNPLDAQIAQERAAAELENQTAGQQFTRQLDIAKEGRERFTAQKNADYKSDIADIRQQIANNNKDAASKRIDELEQRIQNQHQDAQDRIQAQRDIADLRAEVSRERMDKPKAPTPQQFAAVEAKKATALQKARTAYQNSLQNALIDDDRKQAQGDFTQAQQDAQDAYENEIRDLGGTADHQDVSQWNGWKPAAAPPAPAPKAGAPPLTLWQGKQDQILHLRNKATGKTEKWQVVNGVPTNVGDVK